MPCDLLENSRSSPTSNHPFNELFPRHRHQLQNHSTPVSCSAKHIQGTVNPPLALPLDDHRANKRRLPQDVLPRRRSRDPAGRWPPCLPRHPLPDVLALPLCRGSLYQHPLRPQEEDLSHPVLGLLHHRLQRALPDCRFVIRYPRGLALLPKETALADNKRR